MIKLSVIVPGYQVEPYARACIEALLLQDVEGMEVLCVNDGSTDGTGDLLHQLSAEDPRLRVWHTPNRGVSAARNLALSHARGQYVAFVDMDDWVPAGALSLLLRAAGGADIVVGDYLCLDEQGQEERIRLPQVSREVALHSILSGEGSLNTPWAKLYRHDFLWEHCLGFSETLRIGEDALFNLQAFDQAGRIAQVHEPVYAYARRPGSAMAEAAAQRYDRHVGMLDAMDAYLQKTGQKTAYYRAFLQLHAALVRSQYGAQAPQAFGPLVRERVQQGVAPGRLPFRRALLYQGMAWGRGAWVYRHLMKGVEPCASA